jgi:hypothetical protein
MTMQIIVESCGGVPISIVDPGLSREYIAVLLEALIQAKDEGVTWPLCRHRVLQAAVLTPLRPGRDAELRRETWVAQHQRLLDAVAHYFGG